MSEPEAVIEPGSPKTAEIVENLETMAENAASSGQIELSASEETNESVEESCESEISQDASISEKNEIPLNSEEDSSSKPDAEKSSECGDESEQSTPKTSRELKSILALAKEAKLDTNISTHRRKTIDNSKLRSGAGTPKPNQKNTNFPVTAENELDFISSTPSSPFFDKKMPMVQVKKRKVYLLGNPTEGALPNDERRSLPTPGLSSNFIMLKKSNKDVFCWRCHHDSVQIACETCPRAYHLKCLKQQIVDMEHWPCPECVSILKAESTKTRTRAMKGMTLEHLCSLLKFAWKRMVQCNGSEPFMHPVDEKQFPEYRRYIIQPMTLTMLERNVKNNLYGSTTAFEADAKWIVHNSIIFNSSFPDQSKLTSAAKAIVKICKQEMAEIENCPSCYLNANTKKHTWFVEVCPKPHLLVWAKLKGFPYWPAKVMSVNASGMADVRFFGAHDKAWVSCKDCYLYSLKDPNSGKQKRNDIIECQKELELYVENLKKIYDKVMLAPFKTLLDPDPNHEEQLLHFLPGYNKAKEGGEKKATDEVKNGSEGVKLTIVSKSEVDAKKLFNGEAVTRIEPLIKSNRSLVVAKPIKAILVRKRVLSDGSPVSDTPTIKLAKRESNSARTSLDDSDKKSLSPNSKLKMTDQLIKKLEADDHIEKNTPIEPTTDKTTSNDMDRSLIRIRPIVANKSDENVDDSSKSEELPSKSDDANKKAIIDADNDESSQEGDEEMSIEIDPANICSIIHSSLTPAKKLVENSAAKKRKIDDVEPASEKETEKVDEKEEEEEKKTEVETSEDKSFPPNKMLKLVPIENILQKTPESDEPAVKPTEPPPETSKEDDKIVENEPITIKNEIESEDEDNNDKQYMEAKRQYLSALNISEKQKQPSKPKQHAIRTRSKTEEKKTKIGDESPATPKTNETVITSKEITVKSITKLPPGAQAKHKARKSFPTPNYSKKPIIARQIIPKPNEDVRVVNTSIVTSSPSVGSVMILPKLHYNKPPPLLARDMSNPPVLKMLPKPAIQAQTLPVLDVLPRKNVDSSQNYIPQNEEARNGGGSGGGVVFTSGATTSETAAAIDKGLTALKEILPESLNKTMGDLLAQQPPKLRPKPTPLLTAIIDSGVPSTAGPNTSKINSMAQKLGDYFRSLLVETINDLGKNSNPEATITNLKLEIEAINHQQSIELAEIRRNVTVALKDIQKCVLEERDRISNEIKSNFELEMNKKVEEAKSKQWCANCLKEAQFYCCWNTSYCDYPCQQKHWPKHMSKCTQTVNQTNSQTTTVTTPTRPTGGPVVISGGASKLGTVFKSQKVYLKRASTSLKSPGSAGGQLTLVESTPGNFELLGTGALSENGQVLATNSVFEKIKSRNLVSVTSSGGATSKSPGSMKKSTITATIQATNKKSTPSSSDSETTH